jgi:hypothetical protein
VVGRGSRRGARVTERSHAGYLELIDGQVETGLPAANPRHPAAATDAAEVMAVMSRQAGQFGRSQTTLL